MYIAKHHISCLNEACRWTTASKEDPHALNQVSRYPGIMGHLYDEQPLHQIMQAGRASSMQAWQASSIRGLVLKDSVGLLG